jgi:hypothetical protein
MLAIEIIRQRIKIYQKRLSAGDKVPSLTEIAHRAGIHRDTIYTLIGGNRICERSQFALSRVLEEIDIETAQKPKTKLMTLSFKQGGVSLQIGLGNRPLLTKR